MLLFLYGEDTYRSQEKLAKIISKFREKDKLGLNYSVFENDFSVRDLQGVLCQAPFCGQARLVLVKNIFQSTKNIQAEIVALIKRDKIPFSAVLIFWQDGVPDQRSKLFKILQEKAKIELFAPLGPHQLRTWMQNFVRVQKGMIEPEAVAELVERTGNDLNMLARELEKICAYAAGQKISAQMVRALVRAKLETDIFKLVDALSRKDQESALLFISDQIASGANGLYLLAMMTYAFRNLLMVKDLAERGFGQQEIMKRAKLHPFVVRKTAASASRFELADLKKIYTKLLDLDWKIKTGEIRPDFGLSMFVFGVTA